MQLEAKDTCFEQLNEKIRSCLPGEIRVTHVCGQRYLGCGLEKGTRLVLEGTPGNALGAYLDGCNIEVWGNAQDAAGDTMNDGAIFIHGSAGDAAGYAMRGGRIYIKGDTGYRAGIHMKEYGEKIPVLIVGGRAGSFLGEYQAGGIIAVLNLSELSEPPVGYFCGTGMHGGKIFLRSRTLPIDLPEQVHSRQASSEDMEQLAPWLLEFCTVFSLDPAQFQAEDFFVLTPNTQNPYKKLYTLNGG